jgi:hypothetical protein
VQVRERRTEGTARKIGCDENARADLADYCSAAAMSQRLRMICKISDSGRGVHVPEKEGNVQALPATTGASGSLL